MCVIKFFMHFRDEHSATPLMVAAKAGHAKVVKLLLQNYAEIDATDKLKVGFGNIRFIFSSVHERY